MIGYSSSTENSTPDPFSGREAYVGPLFYAGMGGGYATMALFRTCKSIMEFGPYLYPLFMNFWQFWTKSFVSQTTLILNLWMETHTFVLKA